MEKGDLFFLVRVKRALQEAQLLVHALEDPNIELPCIEELKDPKKRIDEALEEVDTKLGSRKKVKNEPTRLDLIEQLAYLPKNQGFHG